jgi:VWFA-related protein
MLIRSVLPALLLVSLALAQDDASTQPFFIGTNVVVAPTVVTDHHGAYINDIKSREFHLTDNGKPQDIKVDVTYVPISLVVAIQANATAEPALAAVRKIGPLLQTLVAGEQGEVAILAWDHRIQTLQDFTTDTAKLEEALGKLRAGSQTSRLNDAVVEAARMLRTRPEARRRVLLLIGEARDYGSEAKVRDALTDLQFANVSVYSVNINRFANMMREKPEDPRPDPIPATAYHMPAGVPPTPENARQLSGNATNSADFVPAFAEIFRASKSIFVKNPVEVYTKFTGGEERAFITQKDLERAMGSIGDELHAEYLLSYTPNNKEEGGFHDIVVVVDRPSVKIRTRPGYWVATQN